jgi:hypothetical protein
MDNAVGFDEFRWLQELAHKTPKQPVPEAIGARLVTRGLIERKNDGYVLTARGRIAIAKLG